MSGADARRDDPAANRASTWEDPDYMHPRARGHATEQVPAYQPWPMPPILLPLGASKGASVLPFSRNGTVVGDWMTATMKGKSLFIPRYEKEFGVKSSQPGAAEKDRT